ncbi:MAG: 3-phosphoserine/phosphohydroxythreonine transaminase [Myxococcaceae bacterium]|nr:3-phosphoserine/phosphohydroxythreonine transaminase [Myxococcaceae bacterium]
MRVINFNPGPAGLPLEALTQARDELLDYQGTGMSIMEHSHRGPAYEAVHQEAIALITKLAGVPASHQVLLLPGPAHLHFATVPMNFLHPGKRADYVVTGTWAERAVEEAQLVGQARTVISTRDAEGRYQRVPRREEIAVDPQAAYVHTTSNNTIFGTQFHPIPDFGAVPHICDVSSDFLSRPLDVKALAFAYAGAQKNLGPSGLVVGLGNKAFLASARKDIPKVLRYQTHAEADSLYHTPNTFAVYLMRNVLQWIDRLGGLPAMERRNRAKAEALYGAIDRRPDLFQAPVEKPSRSWMNIVFRLPSQALETEFLKGATAAGMVGLKGHRSVGGVRVSAYNAVSEDDVKALVGYMDEFARKH